MSRLNLFKLYFIILNLIPIGNINAQYYPVPEVLLDKSMFDSTLKIEKLDAFSISELITVREFKAYLISVKKDSSKVFYKNQLPASKSFDLKLFNRILKDENLQKAPIPGVSWIIARNYCLWLTNKSKEEGTNFKYDLPFLYHLMSFQKTYDSLPQILETWTLNSYDESVFHLNPKSRMGLNRLGLDYYYNALDEDPPSMKRKIIYGGSYHMNFKNHHKPSFRCFQYDYQDSSSKYIGFRVIRRNINQSKNVSFEIDDTNISSNFSNNHLNGIYIEKYKNGRYKTIGEFENGQRTGFWSVWDSTGVLLIRRNYFKNGDCDFVYPKTFNPFEKIYIEDSSKDDKFKRKNDNVEYPYLYIKEKNVEYSKRLWRVLDTINEPELFKQIDFKALIINILQQGIPLFYFGEYGDFRKKLDDLDSIKDEIENWDFNRFEIKEDFFFNVETLTSDTRQIGFNIYKSSEDKSPSYSIYFPYVRPEFAKLDFKTNGFNEIKNLSDVFFFNQYRGDVIRKFQNDKQDLIEESKFDYYQELEKIVEEHNLWIKFNR